MSLRNNCVKLVLCEVLGYGIPQTCIELYLGSMDGTIHEEDKYLVNILHAAGKKAITQNWLRIDAPDIAEH